MNQIDKILLNLIELECTVIHHSRNSTYSLIYKNYRFEFKNGFGNFCMVWLNSESFTIEKNTVEKVKDYVKHNVDLNVLEKKVEQDVRKLKLKKVNDLNKI